MLINNLEKKIVKLKNTVYFMSRTSLSTLKLLILQDSLVLRTLVWNATERMEAKLARCNATVSTQR